MIPIDLKLLEVIAEEWLQIEGKKIYPTYVIFDDGSGYIEWEDRTGLHKLPERIAPFLRFLKRRKLPPFWVKEEYLANLSGFSISRLYLYRIELPNVKEEE